MNKSKKQNTYIFKFRESVWESKRDSKMRGKLKDGESTQNKYRIKNMYF